MRKWWRRAVALPKPVWSAMASTVSSVSSSSCWASRMRCPMSQRCGVVPVSCTKRRAKVRSDMFARAASWRTESDWSRWAQPFQQVPQRPVAGGSDGLLDILGLAAVAVRRYYHAPGDAVGDPGALFLPDQIQAGVDAGRGARAADDRIVVDVQDVRVDLGLRVTAGQFVRVPPVRGATPAVEQAGLAQDEGSAADAQHPRAAADRAAERVEQVGGELLRRAGGPAGEAPQALVTDGGQGDQVRLLQPLKADRR